MGSARPEEAAPVPTSSVPGVRRPPIAVSGLVPAYAASVFGPTADAGPRPVRDSGAEVAGVGGFPAARGARGGDSAVRGAAGPASQGRVSRGPKHAAPAPAAGEETPAGAAGELVLRPAGAVAPFEGSGEGAAVRPRSDLDLGVDALEPVVSGLPADEAVARVMRDVADTVRETNQRMARVESRSGGFDFFGRAAAEPAEAASGEAAESQEPAIAQPAAPRAARVGRELPAGRVPTARPLLTHEPRTGRALPVDLAGDPAVDLTAHDDTEQLPKIVDDRRQA